MKRNIWKDAEVPTMQFTSGVEWPLGEMIQYLQNTTNANIKRTARFLGVDLPSNLNKREMIEALIISHPHSESTTETLKNFPSISMTTGGMFCLLCTHGFVYYSRNVMGGEGASDMADAVRLLRPKVVVYDFAAGLVSFMRNVEPQFFANGLGIPCKTDEVSVSERKDEILKLAFTPNKYPKFIDWKDLLQTEGNYAMIDPFHIDNASKDIDRYSRDIRGIHGVADRLNGEVQEQFWSETKKHVSSLNHMQYSNFVSHWNSIVRLHNEKVVQSFQINTKANGNARSKFKSSSQNSSQ